MQLPPTRYGAVLAGVLVLFGSPTCVVASDAQTQSRTEDMSHGPVKVTVVATPAVVHLDRDVLLVIRVEAPSEIEVALPPMSGRLSGFLLSGMYTRGPFVVDGKATTEYHARLTPDIADEYRIAPMAITYADKSVSPAKSHWFPTRALVFETAAPFKGDPGEKVDVAVEPVWIRPPFKTVAFYVFLALAGLALILLVWRLAKRAHRQIQLMRLSPRERALKELDILLGKHLVEKGHVKDFYLQLTMIVRRYIERQHAVRAPEQTTEEFLLAVSADPRFTPTVVAKLKEFLQAADLVKFAAHRPGQADIDGATESAREYVRTDANLHEDGRI